MAKDLENKTAIVTAASRGIGLAIAEKFVAEGAIVYMAVRDSEKNRQLTEQLHDQNENYRCVFYDAFDFTTYAPMIQQVVDEVGHLDILVNNFGTTDVSKDTTLVDGDSKAFFDIVDKNIASVYYTSKYAVKAMLKQETGGSIVNISSVAGTTLTSVDWHTASPRQLSTRLPSRRPLNMRAIKSEPMQYCQDSLVRMAHCRICQRAFWTDS